MRIEVAEPIEIDPATMRERAQLARDEAVARLRQLADALSALEPVPAAEALLLVQADLDALERRAAVAMGASR